MQRWWMPLLTNVKTPQDSEKYRLTRVAESIRKDAECCFDAVLKGHFRVLEMLIPLRKRQSVDTRAFTGCIICKALRTYHGTQGTD